MKSASRAGEGLWQEWDGDGLDEIGRDMFDFVFTEEHVELNNEIVKTALASALQRWGSYDTMAIAKRGIDAGVVVHGWAGTVDGDGFLTICDEAGETPRGEQVTTVIPITLVGLLQKWE